MIKQAGIFMGFAFNSFNLSNLVNTRKLHFDSRPLCGTNDRTRVVGYIILDLFNLILQDIVNGVSRYKFSTTTESYIDIKCISGDDFKYIYSKGGLRDIDPLLSNFTAYKLEYKYKTRRGFRSFPIMISARHYQTILDKTYQRKPVIPVKTKTYHDYLDIFQKFYKLVPKEDLVYIIKRTEQNILEIEKNKGAVCFFPTGGTSRRMCKAYMFMINGLLDYTNIKTIQQGWKSRMRVKLRLTYMKLNRKWDGYYYAKVDDADIKKLMKSEDRVLVLKDTCVYKIFEECLLYSPQYGSNIIRFPYLIDAGWVMYKRNYVLDDFEYSFKYTKNGLIRVEAKGNYLNYLTQTKNYAFLKLKEIK